jgi:hypothetical protein
MIEHIITALLGVVFTLLGIIWKWVSGTLDAQNKRLDALEHSSVVDQATVPWRDAQLQQMRSDIHELKNNLSRLMHKLGIREVPVSTESESE